LALNFAVGIALSMMPVSGSYLPVSRLFSRQLLMNAGSFAAETGII
jgi:hypothetical protein